MKEKAFTLIELLAVIVILAIIALIATPIILGIIKDARETSNLRSAELYLESAKLAIARINIEEELGDTTCTVLEYGNLNCTGIDEEVSVQVSNSQVVRGGGILVFSEGKLISVEGLKIDFNTYRMDADGNLAVVKNENNISYNITVNVTNGTYTGDSTINKNGTATVTIIKDNDNYSATAISVTGSEYTYNEETGVVTLTNPTGDVTIIINFRDSSNFTPSYDRNDTVVISPYDIFPDPTADDAPSIVIVDEDISPSDEDISPSDEDISPSDEDISPSDGGDDYVVVPRTEPGTYIRYNDPEEGWVYIPEDE